MDIPLYAEDLITELDKMFPEKCPDINMPERNIFFYSGQRELVRMLVLSLKYQKENNKAKEIIKNVHEFT